MPSVVRGRSHVGSDEIMVAPSAAYIAVNWKAQALHMAEDIDR